MLLNGKSGKSAAILSESDSKSFVEMDDNKNKTNNNLSMVCSLEDEESEMSDDGK